MKYPAEGGNQEFSKGADGERTLSAPLIFIRRLFMGAFDRVLSGIRGWTICWTISEWETM